MTLLQRLNSGSQRKGAFRAILIFSVFLIIEVFLFNLPFWQTISNPVAHPMSSTLGPGLKKTDNGLAQITDPHEAWQSFSNTKEINYFYVNPSDEESKITELRWQMSTEKKQDGGWYEATGTSGYCPKINSSRYIHVGGLSTKIKLHYFGKTGDLIPILQITPNPRVPYNFSIPRLGLEAVLFFVLAFLNPRSKLFRRTFSKRDLTCCGVVLLLVLCEIIFTTWLWLAAGSLHSKTGIERMPNGSYFDFDQYADLAKSLLKGKTYLDIPVSQDLANMSNPYDTASRIQISAHSDKPILFDTAFWNGKYYCYFGVLPAILLYIPYQLLFNTSLTSGMAIYVLNICIIFASTVLGISLSKLINKERRNSLGSTILACCCLYFGTVVPQNVGENLFYAVPQLMGLFFTLLAFTCWIQAKTKCLSKKWLAAGAFSLAMTLGCRPQFTLSVLLAFPLFWNEIVTLWKEGLKSAKGFKKELTTWLAALIPFILGITPFFAYNAIRFDNFLDFGANYNLTGYDMTNHSLPLTQLIPLAFSYFLQPPNIATQFPFIEQTNSNMPLWLPTQPSHGGFFFFVAPYAIIILLPVIWKKAVQKINSSLFYFSLLLFSVIIFIFDAHIVGYDIRYSLDFCWPLAIAVSLIILAQDTYRDEAQPSSPDRRSGTDRMPLPDMSTGTYYTTQLVVILLAVSLVFLFYRQLVVSPVSKSLWWELSAWFNFI